MGRHPTTDLGDVHQLESALFGGSCFGLSLGEFGATLMLAGNIPGRTQTLPLAIYEAVMAGEDRAALLLSMILTAVSVVVILIAGRLGRRSG